MIVRDAKAIAQQWVAEQASHIPGFSGAFIHGSANWLEDLDTLPASSDLDIIVVVDGPVPAVKPGKFRYRNVLLEVSFLPLSQLESPAAILGQYHLAGSFHHPSVIADPSGHLTEIQAGVARDYAKREWVYRRCKHARYKVMHGFPLRESDAFHEQVNGWLFPAGVTTHILLVAGLKNPTVRTRYVATRELLAEYGCMELYPKLLGLLGCAQMTNQRAAEHLAWLTAWFGVARDAITTPFPFAADISDIGRAVAIDGSRDLIERGDHREAIFWIVATATRCRAVFWNDAPQDMLNRFDPGYRRLLVDLGMTSFTDLQQGRHKVEASLPEIWATAEAIIAANPGIRE